MIPSIIHQYWDGEYPSKYQQFSDSFKNLNPNFEYNIWNKNSVLEVTSQHILFEHIKSSKHPIVSSDIARIVLLDLFGGLYFDSDIRPEKPIPKYMLYHDCFACYENELNLGQTIANGAIGSIPKSLFITSIINEILKIHPKKIEKLNNSNCWLVTGPRLWTKVFFDTLYKQSLFVYPSWYFIPNHYSISHDTNYIGYITTHIWKKTYGKLPYITHYGHNKKLNIINDYKELNNFQND